VHVGLPRPAVPHSANPHTANLDTPLMPEVIEFHRTHRPRAHAGRPPGREDFMDWFWLLVIVGSFALFVGFVGVCGRLR